MGWRGLAEGGRWPQRGWTEALLFQVDKWVGLSGPGPGGEVRGETPGSDLVTGGPREGMHGKTSSLRSLCVYCWRSPISTVFLKD